MKFFDAHCDTVLPVQAGTHEFLTGRGTSQVSLPGMISAGLCTQVFACFILSREWPGAERAAAVEAIEVIHGLAEGSDGRMRIALDSDSLREAYSGGAIAAILALEGADPLEGDADALRAFHAMGVRSLIPAWEDNAFSGTAFGSNISLTPEGEKLIALCEELRIAVDVSHLSDRAFDHTLEIARRPVIASHSNARAICPSKRNLTDDMIRRLADRGGVLGVNLSSDFLDPAFLERERVVWSKHMLGTPSPAREKLYEAEVAALSRPAGEWIARHVVRAINVGGEDCIGIGGDLDGTASIPEEIEAVEDYPHIADLLADAGLTNRQIEKVCYRNFLRVFCDILPSRAEIPCKRVETQERTTRIKRPKTLSRRRSM
jgi:membrane dipeptidase